MMHVPPPKGGVLHDLPSSIARYRSRAEELRVQAETPDKDAGARETLLHVAESYDHMAERLEKMARASRIPVDRR
jgi:hypothetical protein